MADVCGNMDGLYGTMTVSPAGIESPELGIASVDIPSTSNLNTYLIDFFSKCDVAMVDESQIVLEPLNDHRFYMKCLGGDIYLLASVFQKNVTVQIRKFILNTDDKLIPTRSGVTFKLTDWYFFLQKINTFNLVYNSASFVCDNSILVLSNHGCMILQELRSMKYIELNECHLSVLLENLLDFTKQLREFIYEKYLPALIATVCVPTVDIIEATIVAESRLYAYLETSVCMAMKSAYVCEGCAVNSPSQRRHMCIMETDFNRFNFLGNDIFLLINYMALAQDFISDCNTISYDFLFNFNFDNMTETLFKKI